MNDKLVIILLIFLVCITLKPKNKEKFSSNEDTTTFSGNYYMLDDSDLTLHNNSLCSKLCCGKQYPLPFQSSYNNVCENENDYIPSDIVCKNSFQDSGCLCIKRNQFNNLTNRGGNAR